MSDLTCARLLIQGEKLADARRHLSAYRGRGQVPEEVWANLKEVKASAVAESDQLLAKAVWCLETIGAVQDFYLKAFESLQAGSYYDGWGVLERCEIALLSLDRHVEDAGGLFGLEFIRTHVERFQSLFPYTLFLSPEIIKEEVTCGLCSAPVSLRNHCGHRIGEIYNGDECVRIVSRARVLAISFVRNPVQKYSVPFLKSGTGEGVQDHYDYGLVRRVVEGLRSPWDDWTAHWTKIRHPHERFRNVGRNAACPCGSGKKYKKCCLNESGVLRPHCEITFSVPPPAGTPTFAYSDS